jgi:sterol desaturase/sphingolipid hydroxylase (fatty acid hydroxylase superfamily)
MFLLINQTQLEWGHGHDYSVAAMTEGEFNLVRSAGFVVAAGLAVALQRWRPHARIRQPNRSNVGLWAVNLIVLSAVCGGCACTVARWAATERVGFLNVIAAPLWMALPVTVLALDFVSYCWHRANHRIRPLWRFHQVHHSDGAFSVSTGVRFHPGELVLSLPLRLVAIAAVGAPLVGVVVFEIVFSVANLIEHGDIDLPLVFERRVGHAFITPAFHRRHHSRRRHDLDSNYGTIFVIWDRLLGTFVDSSSAARVDTGLPELSHTPGLHAALLLPRRVYGRATT